MKLLQLIAVKEHIGRESSEIFNQELVSNKREKYNTIFSKEVELNSNFRRFVLNYKAAHEGKNTRRDQVQVQGILTRRKKLSVTKCTLAEIGLAPEALIYTTYCFWYNNYGIVKPVNATYHPGPQKKVVLMVCLQRLKSFFQALQWYTIEWSLQSLGGL